MVGEAGPTIIEFETTFVTPLMVKLMVIVPATSVFKSINEAIPPEAVIGMVPKSVPGPE